ncbi:MAG: hypothetical protein GY772_12810 [bacterium]|nr:hypothetical protein [bacterium]
MVVSVCPVCGPPCPDVLPGTVPEEAAPGDAPTTSDHILDKAGDLGGGAPAPASPKLLGIAPPPLVGARSGTPGGGALRIVIFPAFPAGLPETPDEPPLFVSPAWNSARLIVFAPAFDDF